MPKKHCQYCQDGKEAVAFIFADDDTQEVEYAEYCPMCGRKLVD